MRIRLSAAWPRNIRQARLPRPMCRLSRNPPISLSQTKTSTAPLQRLLMTRLDKDLEKGLTRFHAKPRPAEEVAIRARATQLPCRESFRTTFTASPASKKAFGTY